ncbi:hypothetical protein BDZ45DRAFT_734991 [Acephala macrosclerotiorum]|nr:hypothetical protein BDZ45DRAFT_734991 [Acephala macrosclerotiorum]
MAIQLNLPSLRNCFAPRIAEKEQHVTLRNRYAGEDPLLYGTAEKLSHSQNGNQVMIIMISNTLRSRSRSNDADFTIGTLGFEGTLHGVKVELNGKVQEMYAKFSNRYPEVVANATKLSANEASIKPSLKPRFPASPIHHQQTHNWYGAYLGRIEKGIQYLQQFNGVCNTGPGFTNCVRISCSWDSAIFLCNDNPYLISENCAYIASFAQDLAVQYQRYQPSK